VLGNFEKNYIQFGKKVNNFFNNHTPNVLNVLVKKYEYKVVELLGKKKNQINYKYYSPWNDV